MTWALILKHFVGRVGKPAADWQIGLLCGAANPGSSRRARRFLPQETLPSGIVCRSCETRLSGAFLISLADALIGGKAQPIGCCALLAMVPGEFEVAKMAVTESSQRSGVGRRLLETTIAEARSAGAHRLYLETNRKLAAAIRLYEALGFRHLPPERVVPSEYTRANVYMELYLGEVR